jgi:hypothetical protein
MQDRASAENGRTGPAKSPYPRSCCTQGPPGRRWAVAGHVDPVKGLRQRSLDGLRFGFSTGREMAAELAILCGSLNVGLSRLPKGSGANLTTRFSSGSSICLLIFAPASLFRAVPCQTLPANSL